MTTLEVTCAFCIAASTHLLDVLWSEVLARGLQQLTDIGSWEEFGQRRVRCGRASHWAVTCSVGELVTHEPGAEAPARVWLVQICPVEKP